MSQSDYASLYTVHVNYISVSFWYYFCLICYVSKSKMKFCHKNILLLIQDPWNLNS